jgi:serine/threonine-protein kinase RsbW
VLSGVDAIRKTAANRVTCTIESRLEHVNQIEAQAESFAAQAGLSLESQQGVALAVREAVINAIVHGNAGDPGKHVYITFLRRSGSLELTVRDEGAGFDPASVPDPVAPENLLKRSGRGIFLIRNFIDEVQFRNAGPGTEIKMIKRLRGATAGRKEKA